MPSSKGNTWFITISPRNYGDIDLDKVYTWSKAYPTHMVVKEYGKTGDHEHLHIYTKGEVVEQQQTLRARWLKCLPPDTPKVALHITPCTKYDQLIGYLLKEAKVEVLLNTIDDSEITRLRETYSKVNKNKAGATKNRRPSFDQLPQVIIDYAAGKELPLTGQRDFNIVVRQMARDGYYFIHYLNRMKQVWWWIQCIQGTENDWDNIIGL